MSNISFSVPANLALESYQQLIDAINDWMDRNDLTGSAPSMIALCEARLRRELSPLVFEANGTVSITGGIGLLPTDCDAVRGVFFNQEPLDEVSPDIGRQLSAGSTPRGYSLEANSIRLWPLWDGVVSVLYHGKLPSLSDANSSNELLLEHPDVYFFGAMMFAEGYLSNDSRAAMFKAMWDEAIESLKQFYLRQRRDRPRLRNPSVVV